MGPDIDIKSVIALVVLGLGIMAWVLIAIRRMKYVHDPAKSRAAAPMDPAGKFELTFANPDGPTKVYFRFEIEGGDTDDLDLSVGIELAVDDQPPVRSEQYIGWHAPELGYAPRTRVPITEAGSMSSASFLLVIAPRAARCVVRGLARAAGKTRLTKGTVYVVDDARAARRSAASG